MVNKYRVYAQDVSGQGETPPFYTDSPERAQAEYEKIPGAFPVVKVVLEEENVDPSQIPS